MLLWKIKLFLRQKNLITKTKELTEEKVQNLAVISQKYLESESNDPRLIPSVYSNVKRCYYEEFNC